MTDTSVAEIPRTVVAVFRPKEVRKDLNSIPGGWLVIRRLSYGARLQRLQLASSLKTSIKPGGRGENEDIPAEITSALKETTYHDMRNCIVDHNLTDEKGRLLNFSNAFDIDNLDPAIGDEIAQAIDEHNAVLPDDEQGKSTTNS